MLEPPSIAQASTRPEPVQVTPGEKRLTALLGRWWREERPAWTEESWWDATLRDQVRRLLWLPAGPTLAAALAELAELAPASECPLPHVEDRLLALPAPGHAPGWPCACQVVIAAAWEACGAWVAANAAQSLVRAAGPQPVALDVAGGRHQLHDPAREELAHALRWTVPTTGNRVSAARALVASPELVALVESATISPWAARLVTEHLVDLDVEQAGLVVAAVASRVRARLAGGRRPYHSAEVNRIARAARLRMCPETEQSARVRAFSGRRVVVHRQADGMATLIAELAESDAHRIHRRLSALAAGLAADAAAGTPSDPRTRDQIRADVLVDLLLGAGPPAQEPPGAAAPPRSLEDGRNEEAHGDADTSGSQATGPSRTLGHGGTRPDIQVIVRLETLLALSDDPAEVPGLGPIPAAAARALAADGRWTAWIADASGSVTSTGSLGYTPSAAVARLVRAREPHCRFPGCRQPASLCDLDHVIPWPRGETSPENLGPLCRRHHNLKTHGLWELEASSPRSGPPATDPRGDTDRGQGWRWRSPAGLVIHDSPAPALGWSSPAG